MRQQNWTRGKSRGGGNNYNRNYDNNSNMRFNETSQFGSRNQNDNSNFRTQHEFQPVCITIFLSLEMFSYSQ